MNTGAVKKGAGTRIAMAASSYRREAKAYASAISKAPDQETLTELLRSYRAAVWSQGRCDLMSDLCRANKISRSVLQVFAERLPLEVQREKPMEHPLLVEDVQEERTAVTFRGLLKRKGSLFLMGAAGAVFLVLFMERIFR